MTFKAKVSGHRRKDAAERARRRLEENPIVANREMFSQEGGVFTPNGQQAASIEAAVQFDEPFVITVNETVVMLGSATSGILANMQDVGIVECAFHVPIGSQPMRWPALHDGLFRATRYSLNPGQAAEIPAEVFCAGAFILIGQHAGEVTVILRNNEMTQARGAASIGRAGNRPGEQNATP